jgi:hypothetical protein
VDAASSGRPGGAAARDLLLAGAAAVALNAALSFNNVWPTLWIKPDLRLAPELVAAWVAMLAAAWRYDRVPRVLVGALAGLLALLVVGRYADVTVPAIMGREINLYWDGAQLPRFVWVTAKERGWGVLAALVAAAALGLYLLYRVVRALLGRVARDLAPRALRSPAALGATAVAAVLALLNAAGQQWTWPYFSKPVTASVLRQAAILRTAASPERLARALPPSPRFESDLRAIRGMDVHVVFLESYGAVAFDDDALRGQLAAAREALAGAIAASGRAVVSGFVRSPTFGGASDLAHLGLLSGIDLSDPLRHDLLLASDRPTLVSFFRAKGYDAHGVYPALSWAWPESAFYRYTRLVDGRELAYTGPAFGYWRIPDQYAMARYEAMHPVGADSPPRFLLFATMNTHAPFRPVPPYQPDWARLLGETPFDPEEAARAIAEGTGWHDLRAAYGRVLDYQYRWLAGHVARPRAREAVMVLIGDHQPLGAVSGPGARWDVPVHVVATPGPVLDALAAHGFRPGLAPAPRSLGGMHELAPMLLEAFDGGAAAAVAAAAQSRLR